MQGCHCSFVMHVKPGQAEESGVKQGREASCFEGFGNVQDGLPSTIWNMTESQESWRNTYESDCLHTIRTTRCS
jgi:hypothetical protein